MNLEAPILSVLAFLTLLAGLTSGAIIGHFCKPGESPKQAFARGFITMIAACLVLFAAAVVVL